MCTFIGQLQMIDSHGFTTWPLFIIRPLSQYVKHIVTPQVLKCQLQFIAMVIWSRYDGLAPFIVWPLFIQVCSEWSWLIRNTTSFRPGWFPNASGYRRTYYKHLHKLNWGSLDFCCRLHKLVIFYKIEVDIYPSYL